MFNAIGISAHHAAKVNSKKVARYNRVRDLRAICELAQSQPSIYARIVAWLKKEI